MKCQPLQGICKDCLGCMLLENPAFRGVYKCKHNEPKENKEPKKEWVQERIDLWK